MQEGKVEIDRSTFKCQNVSHIIRIRSQFLPAIHNSIAIFSALYYVRCSRRRRHGCYGNEINVSLCTGLAEGRPLVLKSTRHLHLQGLTFLKIHVIYGCGNHEVKSYSVISGLIRVMEDPSVRQG